MAAGAKKGGPERGEKELKKEKMGRRVPYGEWVRVGETYGGLEKGRGSGGGVYIGGGWESVRNNDPFFFFSARNWQVQNFVEDLFDAWGCLELSYMPRGLREIHG